MSNPNTPEINNTTKDAERIDRENHKKLGSTTRTIVMHHDRFSGSKSQKTYPKTVANYKKESEKPKTYASVAPFNFPREKDYQITSREKEMEKAGKFVSQNEVTLRNQAAANKRIEFYTSKLEELIPDPRAFRYDAGRDQDRINYCIKLQNRISTRHAYNSYDREGGDESIDFAFEGLLYKFVESGLFSNGDHKAKMIFTSKIDDYINADHDEEAHATDCAFLIPVTKNEDDQQSVEYIPIAIAATTSASDYPQANSPAGKTIIEEKLDKYPKNQAYVEFSTNEDGSRRPADFMPVFVLGFQHDKVRKILTTCNNPDDYLTNDIKHNFYLQIIAQCILRIELLQKSVKEGNEQAKAVIKKYRAIYDNFMNQNKELCKNIGQTTREFAVWDNDRSASLVIQYTTEKEKALR